MKPACFPIWASEKEEVQWLTWNFPIGWNNSERQKNWPGRSWRISRSCPRRTPGLPSAFHEKGRRGVLIPSLGLVLCSPLCRRFLTGVQLTYPQRSQNIFSAASAPSPASHFPPPNARMLPAAGALIPAYLLLCRVRINLSNITSV